MKPPTPNCHAKRARRAPYGGKRLNIELLQKLQRFLSQMGVGAAHGVRSNPLDGQLVTFYRQLKGRKHLTAHQHPAQSGYSRKQAKREKEPWLLVVSPLLQAYSSVRVVAYYRTRMQIEEGLRDTKSSR